MRHVTRLADQFFLTARHDANGRLRMAPRPARVGLAAALLAELVVDGHLWADNAMVSLRGRRRPVDPLAASVLHQIAANPGERDVRTWIKALSVSATQRVGWRLAEAGIVRCRQVGLPWTRHTAYVPVDMSTAAVPWALLSYRLTHAEPLGAGDLLLGGLCRATGLDRWLLDGRPVDVRVHLDTEVARMWAPAREVVRATEAVVGNAVLSARH
ncbi:GPP34 family phosphoprotein [Micromonospora sp. DT233]|uniref:GPP34 family phosphoprotein n=1 Tax=Micromonospora sp. DT233 TaxID=3393432 RepID=UPI003CF16155